MATSSNRQLLDLVRDKGACFDFFNTSSAVARVPKLAHNCGGVLQVRRVAWRGLWVQGLGGGLMGRSCQCRVLVVQRVSSSPSLAPMPSLGTARP